ncbi:Olfactomedin-like domain protein [Cooperia oncophora]
MDHQARQFQFPSARALNNSEPKTIVTLPYPFHGTDNTVHNKTVYYSYDSALISFSMKNGDMKELRLNASLGILYNNSTSRMNIQADEHGLWILYREIGETFLTATRIEPKSLKIVSVRTLLAITPERLCNAFVRCGTLYTVTCDVDHVTVAAAYDFHTHMYVNGKQSEWIGTEIYLSVMNLRK